MLESHSNSLLEPVVPVVRSKRGRAQAISRPLHKSAVMVTDDRMLDPYLHAKDRYMLHVRIIELCNDNQRTNICR